MWHFRGPATPAHGWVIAKVFHVQFSHTPRPAAAAARDVYTFKNVHYIEIYKIREQASFLFVYFIYRINIIKRDSGRKKKKNQLNWIEPAHLTFSLTYKNIIYTSTILYINEKILNCWSVSLSCSSSFFLPPYIFCIASPSAQVFRLGERVFLVVGWMKPFKRLFYFLVLLFVFLYRTEEDKWMTPYIYNKKLNIWWSIGDDRI